MKRFFLVVGVTALILITIQLFSPTQAQVGLVESRLSRIESQLVGIQSQINQLSANRPAPRVSVPTPSNLPIPSRPSRFSDAQFDRLATLVIESRDRIQALEEKVARLEKR
ncbi:hypothetical protein IQ250_21100 [Pseudanabaenaceae cyanobacterium LEGE 13415]|nr:hypothetical protein [Pseudanabaenaceae cyanobacterium LEGE 13415]